MPKNLAAGETIFHGQGAAGGVAQGKTLLIGGHGGEITARTISDAEVPDEVARLQAALVDTRRQLLEVQKRVGAALGSDEAALFDAHLLALDDPSLMEQVLRMIRSEHSNAEYAYHVVAGRYAGALESADDDFLRERAADIRDISARVTNTLQGVNTEIDWSAVREPVILIGHDLPPSLAAVLDRTKVAGIATDAGGVTGHTAIMARKLRIPAVVGLGTASGQLGNGLHALIDGHGGALILNPTDSALFQYGQMRERRAALEQRLQDLQRQPAVTFDGRRLILAANIDETADLAEVAKCGAEGIGLFRTEFLFLRSAEPPSEESQYDAYKQAAAACSPAPVVIRTMDVGGDKFYEGGVTEANPFLGWRAIRICLQRPEMFKTQLRAILRASAHGNVKLMFPMVSGVEEVVAALALLDQCREELRAANKPFDAEMETGVMIEVPSAAILASCIAPYVDFFSLGTNDLTQYTLATDRLNERVAHLHSPAHPAILRLVQMTVEAAKTAGIWVGACGEAAGDPSLLPIWVGLGLDEISATPAAIPEAKFLVRRLRQSEARATAEKALRCSTAAEARAISEAAAKAAAPELFTER
jgi:phosphoenolpyruvate-protein phosphotransferase (PTS system enzyme I)